MQYKHHISPSADKDIEALAVRKLLQEIYDNDPRNKYDLTKDVGLAMLTDIPFGDQVVVSVESWTVDEYKMIENPVISVKYYRDLAQPLEIDAPSISIEHIHETLSKHQENSLKPLN